MNSGGIELLAVRRKGSGVGGAVDCAVGSIEGWGVPTLKWSELLIRQELEAQIWTDKSS